MSIKDRRMAQGWTQEQLAELAGLSSRTIQRVERGHYATLETLKCLAAVFETNVSTLMKEQQMTPTQSVPKPNAVNLQEQEAIDYVHNLKGFYMHAILFGVIIPSLAVLNLVISPGQWWIFYVLAAWTFGLALHGVMMFAMFGLFGGAWEQRQFRKRTGLGDQ